MAETSIEWTRPPGYRGASWNALRGCSRVSAGCGDGTGGGCYAERMAHRSSGPGGAYEGLTRLTSKGPRWTGEVRFIPEKLDEPLRTRRPTCWFVNSMSDLFHEKVADEVIAALFGVMAARPDHLFLCLTKRPERMLRWLEWVSTAPLDVAFGGGPRARRLCWACMGRHGDRLAEVAMYGSLSTGPWPLPNVWLGVSIEDQATADERIPFLLECPAAVRWISLEPQLGPVDLARWLPCSIHCGRNATHSSEVATPLLDWVVQGGESGPGARPFDLAWARATRDQCREAGVAYFLKQLGAHPMAPCGRCRGDGIDPVRVGLPGEVPCDPDWCSECGGASQGAPPERLRLDDRKGGDELFWPPDLRGCRAWPEARP